MARIKITTTIDEDILKKAKDRAAVEGFDGVNALIEKALRFYFANSTVTVWERTCPGGWLRKLIIRPDILVIENIRSRKSTARYDRAYYTNDELLEKDEWHKVWKPVNTKDSQVTKN